MSQHIDQEFSGWRRLLWPIHSYEVKKFLPMGIMMFCILFIYTVLRDTKDAILVNAPGAGAESLAFAKGIGVTASAVIFMILYTKAANLFNREGLFYVTALPFLLFFGLYPYFIYPFVGSLHMSLDTIKSYQELYPAVKWMIPLIGNWTYTLFYILSELWGSVVQTIHQQKENLKHQYKKPSFLRAWFVPMHHHIGELHKSFDNHRYLIFLVLQQWEV